jgi:hypothetical protein
VPRNIDYSDWQHTGTHTFERAPVVPNSSFGNAQIGTTNPIEAEKLKHQYVQRLSQAHGTASTDERRVVHVARASGSVVGVEAGPVVVAVGDSTVTVDVKKNGTTILSGVITIDSGDAAFDKVAGAISVASYVTGDVFEVIIDATVGTGTLPQGVFASVVFREGAG